MNTEQVVWFLIGTLQLIALSMHTWVAMKIIELLQRTSILEGKFDAFPIQQIYNNRHRVENLEKEVGGMGIRIEHLEKRRGGSNHD